MIAFTRANGDAVLAKSDAATSYRSWDRHTSRHSGPRQTRGNDLGIPLPSITETRSGRRNGAKRDP